MMAATENPGEGGGRRRPPANVITGDLFPESIPPVPPATWPRAGSRAYEALQALLRGPVNQAEYFDGWRLAASVRALKDDGWDVYAVPILRPGCRREIAEYRLHLDGPATRAALATRER